MPLLGHLNMEKTKFYVPSMYLRKFTGELLVSVDNFLEILEDIKETTSAIEILVDENTVLEYTERIEEIYDATVDQGIEIPIVRIAAPSLYLADGAEKTAVRDDLINFITRFQGFFGTSSPIQLETMSTWQVYEMRNNTVMDADKIPVGYKYPVYAGYVIETIKDFCQICNDLEITPVIEPRVGHVISSPDSVELLESKLGNLPFKVVFDVTHMEFQGINTCDAWQALKEHTIAVHMSDTDVSDNHHTAIGEGQVPWRTLLKYTGEHPEVKFIAVELFGDESDDPEQVKKNYQEGVKEVKALISEYKLTSKYE